MREVAALPAVGVGWSVRVPTTADVPALAALATAHRQAVRGTGGADEEAVAAVVTGSGSWTRRQVLVERDGTAPAAWLRVHDRAAGRTVVELTVVPPVAAEASVADALAADLLAWAEQVALQTAELRGLAATRLDADVDVGDSTLERWLTAAGYRPVRTWLHMVRPVQPGEQVPPPRAGVRVRPVARHEDGLPVASDLQVVHRMLEESFADHFNSYRESFAEFAQRLREDPGHRWDHWWVAEVHDPDSPEAVDGWVPGGSLVSSVSPADGPGGAEGTYVDYIGVHRRARGRGVAKALLHTVLADARDRGRDRVSLEVDADSPTGADGLYVTLGWRTAYRTRSWHGDRAVSGPDPMG